jgi:hypothetical protein
MWLVWVWVGGAALGIARLVVVLRTFFPGDSLRFDADRELFLALD